MAVESGSFLRKWVSLANETRFPAVSHPISHRRRIDIHYNTGKSNSSRSGKLKVLALDRNNNNNDDNSSKKSSSSSSSLPNSNYVVPLDKSSTSSCITRPLAEILRDLNKRIPGNIIKSPHDHHSTFISCSMVDLKEIFVDLMVCRYHANRMLSFYAPGWCGEIRDVIFSDNGSVTVVYRVTIRGSDGEAHRESTGTVSSGNDDIVDPVAAAEEIAFCRACARFGLGLYLYHEE
ncbi:unnamed protein product [Ilex paraguariensis]|uniref:DNA repair RAD52-like protein 2, chloroplastic n=1 Tax=Ilex paraguariensis TaxID=185542 RepID=A0ABC8UCT7_9AQUA